MSDAYGIAIIGAGRVARAHLRAVQATPGTRLVAIADTDLARAQALAAECGALAVPDYRDLLRRDDVQIVMIGLPHFLHAPVTIEACQAGKHVFLEKPMALSVAECDAMIAAAERAGVRLFVAHTQRFFASTIRARDLVVCGRIGQVVAATDTWYKPFGLESRPAWFLDRRLGGGMWLMNGSHMVDRVGWVLDSRVRAVRAWIGNKIFGLAADDTAVAFLELASGVPVTLVHAGYRQGVERCAVEILGTEGMLTFDSYSNLLAVSEDGQYRPIPVERHDPFARELQAFVESLRTGGPLPVPVEWARHIVEVLCACEESSRCGREVVLA